MCRTRVLVLIASAANASMSAAEIHGAPRRAVMSDGRRSSGCTRRSAATLRVYWGSALGRGLGDCELGADGTREIGVVRLPGFRAGIAEHRFAELGEGGLRIAVQQFHQVVDVYAAGLVEGDSERIGSRRDVWC